MTLIDLLVKEWLAVMVTNHGALRYEECLSYWEKEEYFRSLPMLHMAKVAQIAKEAKLPYLTPMLAHPVMEVLRNSWTSVVVPGNSPQRDVDIFDWLFQRGKMNADWVRLYRYSDNGGFDGCEYFFREPKLAILFKLTWVGV